MGGTEGRKGRKDLWWWLAYSSAFQRGLVSLLGGTLLPDEGSPEQWRMFGILGLQALIAGYIPRYANQKMPHTFPDIFYRHTALDSGVTGNCGLLFSTESP